VPGGALVVRAPKHVPLHVVDTFVQSKTMWIQKTQARMQHVQALPSGVRAYTQHKERARASITKRVHELNTQYGFWFNRIAIKNTTRNWGSCSRRKNLNFNYTLIFLPQHLMDYVIVHELCHLQELNHSVRFWALVARVCPDYTQCRRQLLQYQRV
jgi:predicted metal-dependent hydrolase